MELHGAGVHLLLTAPFSPAVLEPDLGDKHEVVIMIIYQIFMILDSKVGAICVLMIFFFSSV